MRYSLNATSSSSSGFRNGGFYGMNIGFANYSVSFFYRPLSGSSVGDGGRLTIGFSDRTGQTIYATTTITVSSAPLRNWSKFSLNLSVFTAPPSANNYFFIEFPPGSRGDFDFNLISCFPPTFENRNNGARLDIAQAFADLKLGFVRLPGGDDVEGPSIPDRFIWNKTIGPLESRSGRRGTWTGYNTEGFGLIELLTFVEDIGATPLLAVYAGYSLSGDAVPEDQLRAYVDEVVHEIEFLTSSADDYSLGALRERMGRKKPFDIKYVEIGNEDWYDDAIKTYEYRWPAFYNALSKRFSNLTLIATTAETISSPPVVDDHYYQVPLYFIKNFRRYENVSRPTPKVLIGEFAVTYDNDSYIDDPTLRRNEFQSIKSAVAESVFRIGLERNSDIIIGGCYSPVLENIDQTQWKPGLIVFNTTLVVRSTSYLAQQMFGENLGNILLNSTATNTFMTHESVRRGGEGDGKLGNLYFVATKNTNNNTLIVKFASVDPNDITVNAQVDGSRTSTNGVAYTLTAGPGIDPTTVRNTMNNPNAAKIITLAISLTDGRFSIKIPSWSVVVVTFSL